MVVEKHNESKLARSDEVQNPAQAMDSNFRFSVFRFFNGSFTQKPLLYNANKHLSLRTVRKQKLFDTIDWFPMALREIQGLRIDINMKETIA